MLFIGIISDMPEMNGILLVDKPAGWTSFDVVAKIRGQVRQATGDKKAKVGHAGTLDPFATGLLIVLIGNACKMSDRFMKLDKAYDFTIRLGQVSTTGDIEGDVTESGDGLNVTLEQFEAALGEFTGDILQMPPAYSAIKVNGKRAYDLARAGKEVKLDPRKVTIYSMEITNFSPPDIKCIVKVSSGTYIRSLAKDIGEHLGAGAHCTQLRRLSIGDYDVKHAKSPENITILKNLQPTDVL